RAADAAVHHQVLGALGHVRVQVVLEHPVRRLGQPRSAAELGTAGRADGTGRIVADGHVGSLDNDPPIIASRLPPPGRPPRRTRTPAPRSRPGGGRQGTQAYPAGSGGSGASSVSGGGRSGASSSAAGTGGGGGGGAGGAGGSSGTGGTGGWGGGMSGLPWLSSGSDRSIGTGGRMSSAGGGMSWADATPSSASAATSGAINCFFITTSGGGTTREPTPGAVATMSWCRRRSGGIRPKLQCSGRTRALPSVHAYVPECSRGCALRTPALGLRLDAA